MKNRKWIDLFLFYSTLVLILSGIVLFIMPHGRVAYFTGWNLFGIDKDGWGNMHVMFGILMSVVVIWHIVINWKPMKKYLFQKESIYALIVTVLITVGSVANVEPFRSVFKFEESIKESWKVSKAEIPIAHGELLTLKEFCNKVGIDVNRAVLKLKTKNITFALSDTLKEIARKNNLTPYEIYEIIKSQNRLYPKSGLGKKTLKEVCEEEKIDFSKCKERLSKAGIKFTKNETLKDIANKNSLTPIEILQIIKK